MFRLAFRIFCFVVLYFCTAFQAIGQLTARNISEDCKVAVLYSYPNGQRDTIFVFNQDQGTKMGHLSLQQSEPSTFRWYKFDYDAKDFEEEPFHTDSEVEETSLDDLPQGGYKVIVTAPDMEEPREFIAWLYMNPGFDFKLLKDVNNEVLHGYKNCFYTDFRLSPNTEQSSFKYYNPMNGAELTFNNRITYAMRPENDVEIDDIMLNSLGATQFIRDNDPPHEDTQFFFRAYDMFGIEKNDNIMYRTILPFAKINPPVLPDTDPESAPVPVQFSSEPYAYSQQNAEYVWRFGTGDSIVFDAEPNRLPQEIVEYTYFVPRTLPYQVTLKVTSLWECEYITPPVTVNINEPRLEVGNVFTPNGDGFNDYFKPQTVSLRRFEISIFTRTGYRVYYYRGNDLRDWTGWDGRIENTGRDASVGVYFYTIRAFGWDDPPTRNPQSGPYRGSFYLYR